MKIKHFDVCLRVFNIFQVDPDSSHSLKQNPASYTQALNAAARGLHRYAADIYFWDVLNLRPISSLYLTWQATVRLLYKLNFSC